MWLYTSYGYLSIVAHYDMPSRLLVRARHPDHIQALFPDADVEYMPSADYPFRVVLPRQMVLLAVSDYLVHMMYNNFKASINDKEYHDACLSVWGTMWEYGEEHR
jgi:hypothetical protein